MAADTAMAPWRNAFTRASGKGIIGMWERIKRLWQQEKQPGPLPLSEQEQQAQVDFLWQELQAQRLDGLALRVRPLLNSTVPEIARKATRILALSHFHQQQYAQAWPLFEQLAGQTQTAHDWFNVVSSATLAGDIERGAAAFEKAVRSHGTSDDAQQPNIATLHHFYACALRDAGEHARAFEHVQVLRAIYEKLPVTTAPQLELRGLPPLQHVLDVTVDVLAHSGDIPAAITWLEEFGATLDVPGQSLTRQAAARLQQRSAAPQPDPADSPPA